MQLICDVDTHDTTNETGHAMHELDYPHDVAELLCDGSAVMRVLLCGEYVNVKHSECY